MQENPFWNLIIKTASVFAVIFLLFGAGLMVAGYFNWAESDLVGIVTVVFAVPLAVFSLVSVNFSNIKLSRELKAAAETAHQLSQGEMLEDDFESSSELFDSLKDISDYMRGKAAIADRISSGSLSADVALCSDSDNFGRSFQNMIERLRLFVQTQETRDALQKSILKLSDEVAEVAAGDLTVQAEVTTEITGEIAEAFNSMTCELRSLIKQVKDVTLQVGASANAINDTTDQLARGSEAQ